MPEQQIDSSRNDRARASPPAASPLRGYAVATLAAALALLFCVLLRPYLAPNYFLPFLGAVVVGAWYGGFGPGLLAGLLSVAASAYFFLAPIHSLRVDAGSDLFRLGIFATVAYLVSWANGRLRSTRAAAERRAEEASLMAAQLQEQAAELEHQTEQAQALNVELEQQIEAADQLRQELEAANEQLRAATWTAEAAARAAHEGEERFRATFEQAAVGIAHVAPDGKWLRVNRRLCEIVGYSYEEMRGLTFQDITLPEDLYSDLAQLRRLTDGEIDTYTLEKRYLRADGSVAWVELTVSAVRGEAGELRYFISVVKDIGKRKALEEERHFLAEAARILTSSLDYEATLAALTRLMVPALADYCSVDVVAPDGEIRRVGCTHADPAKEQLLCDLWERYPYTWEDHTGAPEVLRTGVPQLTPDIADRAITDFAHEEERLRLMRALRPRSYICVPLVARGRVLGALSFVMSDSGRRYTVHDLRRAEELAARAAVAIDNARLYEAAVEADRTKMDFMATMSHELRTPLNAVIGYSDLLLLGIPTPLPEAQIRQAQRIQAAARHLLDVIEEILTFSRLEAGREEVSVERAGAAELARAAAALVEPLATAKGIELRVEVPAASPVLETDPGKVRQILLNLLGNAVKFTERGQTVLRVEQVHGEVRFAVRDTGAGIAAEHLDRVFDSFWQVDQTTSRQAGGTGLGLAVARRMARLLGGEVTAASTPGEGSTFTLSLPARPASPDAG